MEEKVLRWIISEKESGMRIIEFLSKKEIPKKIWKKIKQPSGLLQIQKKDRSPSEILSTGEIIDLSEYFIPYNTSNLLEVIYETNDFIIVNKPSGLLTHPTSTSKAEMTLNDLVLNYYYSQNIPALPHPVIRLDRHTSGLVLYAKKKEIQSFFQKHPMTKTYLALVKGNFPSTTIQIGAPIQRKSASIIEREIGVQGQSAGTQIKKIKNSNHFSLVECRLHTGRTHQIRVHLAALGFPICGDSLYGEADFLTPKYGLHAWKLSFSFPAKSELSFSVTSPIPEYFGITK